MIRELRICFALRPYLDRLGVLSHMKLSTNVVYQILMTAVQALNQVSGYVPDKYKFYVATAVGALQLVGAVIAHHSNPDGTPATVAYEPKG